VATGAPTAQRQSVPVRHRPNIEEMTAPQIEELRKAFTAMQGRTDDRGYGRYAGIHGLPLPKECTIAHGHPAFLPWHRAYLLRFEQALRDTGYDVMLPWWDWTKTPTIPTAFAEPYAPDSSPNPLFSVAIDPQALTEGSNSDEEETVELAAIPNTVRQPERPGTRLPTGPEIATILTLDTEYDQFRSNLDDYHGMVHIWAGGHMGNLPFAAFDPLFWAHHCMIDRLWRIWQGEHSQASFPSSLRGETMMPFNLTAGEVLDPTTLGYDYSMSIAQVPAGS
jgi:tyrosinase